DLVTVDAAAQLLDGQVPAVLLVLAVGGEGPGQRQDEAHLYRRRVGGAAALAGARAGCPEEDRTRQGQAPQSPCSSHLRNLLPPCGNRGRTHSGPRVALLQAGTRSGTIPDKETRFRLAVIGTILTAQ